MKRCGFLLAATRFYVILADAGEWPLYALDRAALGRSIVNHFVQMPIGTLAYGRNKEVAALRK